MTARSVLISMLVALSAAACNDTPGLPGPSDPTPFARSEVFTGVLERSGSGFYSFVVVAEASVELTLTSLVSTATNLPVSTSVTVGFGVPSGTDCATSQTAPATVSLGPQITRAATGGTYCVRLSDPGALSEPVAFAVRITIRTGGTPTPTPGTITFASQVIRGGFTARAFDASASGTLTARLESLSPDLVGVGLGIGIPTFTGDCPVTVQVTNARPGTELSVGVAAATYCVKVFDPGTITTPVSFTVRISHP